MTQDVRTQINHLLSVYDSIGWDVRSFLAPGIDSRVINQDLADADIKCHPSVVEWYSVVGGVNDRLQKPREGVFLPYLVPLDFKISIDEYQFMVGEGYWEKGVFPISHDYGGEFFLIGRDGLIIRYRNDEAGSHYGFNLSEFIEIIIQSIKDELVALETEDGATFLEASDGYYMRISSYE